MKIRWFGQSAFLLSGSVRVAIDPFGDVGDRLTARGLQFGYPRIEGVDADVLLITHEHFDHNAADAISGDPETVRSIAGTFDTRSARCGPSRPSTTTRPARSAGPTRSSRSRSTGCGSVISETSGRRRCAPSSARRSATSTS